MTMSKAQIFNITLNILGVSNPLENTEGSDNRTILLNNYYSLAKEFVLKSFDWNFASRFIELTLVDTKEKIADFLYTFEYPNDCICARDLFEKNSYVLEKYTIASIENGQKVIATNVKQPVLRYTKRVDKEIYFTCEFSLALAYYLASMTSATITGSIQKGELAYDKYTKILKQAKVLNAKEGTDIIYENSTYLDSRG